MADPLRKRLAHGWSAFRGVDDHSPEPVQTYAMGTTSYSRPDRSRPRIGNERTIISSIYTRMAVDIAGVRIEHCRVGEDGQYQETIKSGLNECLNIKANLDQNGRHLRQDIALTLLQEGVIAIIPVDTTINPTVSGSWDVQTIRVGVITQWWPEYVRVRAYNQKTGKQEEVTLHKSQVAIVENPFYATMNEPNSTLQRLIRKLAMLDHVDEISSSGKLDIIIQLPYVVKSESRKTQAENRRKELEQQLTGSTYGIAYADGTENITQLNRTVTNNLLEQVQYLKDELYHELGLTEAIMNGTADDVEMMNYTNRVIEPVMDAVTEAMISTFITKTGRTQGQTLMYFQSPLKLIPISQLADIVDVLSRNQIITPNEVRPSLGLKPSKAPQANSLVNSNMPLDQQITDDDAEDPEETQAAADEARLNRAVADLGL